MMVVYAVKGLKEKVSEVVCAYNADAPSDARIERVSLFGSYAKGCARDTSDIDFLVSFTSAVVSLFTLAKVLDSFERHLGTSVDIVQDPILEGSLLQIEAVIPLYE